MSCQSDLHSSNTAHTHHGMMYFVKKVKNLQGNRVQGVIIPLANIQQSCMLFPTIFNETPDTTWLHHHFSLHPSFWLIIGLVNIYIGQFINLLYMYI